MTEGIFVAYFPDGGIWQGCVDRPICTKFDEHIGSSQTRNKFVLDFQNVAALQTRTALKATFRIFSLCLCKNLKISESILRLIMSLPMQS